MIKYQFAYDSKNSIINVFDLFRETLDKKEKFICISCKNLLIPHLGEVRQKYFAHKPNSVCSKETYLHNLAKNLLYQEFKKCIANKEPFYIEILRPKKCNATVDVLGIICDLGDGLYKYDLTNYYSDIKLEYKDGNFKPDLILINKNEKDRLYIEIAVTHFSETKKIESKIRIIEISISNESDLEPIVNHCISERSTNTMFVNFKIKEDIGNYCNNLCKKKFDFFVIDNNGECNLYEKSLTEFSTYLKTRNSKPSFYDISDLWKDSSSKFRYFVSKFYVQGIKIQDCFLCRYHGEDEYWFKIKWSIFCKFLKSKEYTSKAAYCKYFKAENKYIDGGIKDGERDLWIMKEFPSWELIPDHRIKYDDPFQSEDPI